ncbi:hypothetical protein LLH00_13325 [bacterium]|nr:hypothetical protein [bacterium]
MEQNEKTLPRWCDLRCAHASFPEDYGLDGAGSCRTFAGLHCAVLNRIVAKNAPCAARLELGDKK